MPRRSRKTPISEASRTSSSTWRSTATSTSSPGARAFNGTEPFKPGELVSFLESIGARFGPHVNASTSFDETVYMLEIPTDRPGYVDRGMTVLQDFAGGISFLPDEIEKERGVVLEEWRGRLGAGSR